MQYAYINAYKYSINFLDTFIMGKLGVNLNTISCMYVCMYVCIDLYIYITYVFNNLLQFLLSSLNLIYFCVFWGCSSTWDVTCIPVLPRKLRISSPLSITRTNCPSAKFISAAILVCKDVDVFMKRMISLIQILRQSVVICNELIGLGIYLYYYIVTNV
jgi:hypothetical protein